MMLTERDAADREPADEAAPDVVMLLLRFLAALVIVLVTAGVVAHFARTSAEGAARGFVEHFGVLGMGFGTLLADGLHFPVPPQFYMLVAIASRTPFVEAFVAIATGSVLAGGVGYAVLRSTKQRRLIITRSSTCTSGYGTEPSAAKKPSSSGYRGDRASGTMRRRRFSQPCPKCSRNG